MTVGSESQVKKNPFKLIWYNSDMTENQISENNTRYWEWEIKYNNLKL